MSGDKNNRGFPSQTMLGSLLVVYDDLSIPFGELRLKPGGQVVPTEIIAFHLWLGGSGGHNGISHIQECLQSSNFARLRVGVGPSTVCYLFMFK